MPEFTEKVSQLQETLRLKSKLFNMEAEDRWNELKKLLESATGEVGVLKDKAGAGMDHARLQATLARMDAVDTIEEKISIWKRQLAERKDEEGVFEIAGTLDKLLDGLESVLVKFRN